MRRSEIADVSGGCESKNDCLILESFGQLANYLDLLTNHRFGALLQKPLMMCRFSEIPITEDLLYAV